MKCNEIINEGQGGVAGKKGMKADHAHALPHAHYYPDLDNSSGYKAYRFGLALAGMPDKKMPKEGPTGLKMVTIGYTDAEEEILKATAAYFKTPRVRLTPDGSDEPNYINQTSPVPFNSGKKIKRKS